MAQEPITDHKILDWLRTRNPDLDRHIATTYVEVEGILETIEMSIGPILIAKNITGDGLEGFIRKAQQNVPLGDVSTFINHVATPPFDIQNYLDKVSSISEMCKDEGVNDKNGWLTSHKFPGTPPAGAFEAFMTVMFKDMSNPPSGDVCYKGKDIVEVKGSGGRLRGQYGYNNGIISYIEELMLQMRYHRPKNKLHYNIGKDTINVIDGKILLKQKEVQREQNNYDEKLEGKRERMDKASKNTATKKYADTKLQYEKYKAATPKSIVNLWAEIDKLREDADNCTLENISMDLAVDSLDKSIEFLSKIFSRKYINSSSEKLERFLRNGLNKNGSFNEFFLREYLIFEYEYYQFLEDFKYFCLANLKEDTMLIITSGEEFRNFVYKNVIKIKSPPSFSDNSGQQGMVFSIDLKC